MRTSAPRTYKLGTSFPSEGFVQEAIERYFHDQGFDVDATGQVDLLCVNRTTGERWHIEAKGKTAQPGLDFRTCLGQLMQQMRERDVHHAVAVPDIPQYAAQIALIAPWVVDTLRIHWIVVTADGTIRVTRPGGVDTSL